MWSNFISQGWSQKNHQLSDQEIEMLFQPQEERTVLRSCVSLGASTYYNKDLEHYEGEVVKVSYDIHNAEKVQVWDQEDRLICYAYFEKNKSSYFPMSQVEKAREERAKRRAKIKLNQLDEIEMERRGVIDIAPVQTKVLDFKAASPQIFADREALVAEMAEEKKSEIPHGDKKRYLFWHELDDRLSLGGTLKENELKFYEAFRNSLTYKTFKEVDADLAILVHQ
jgi:putative transposase